MTILHPYGSGLAGHGTRELRICLKPVFVRQDGSSDATAANPGDVK